MQSGSIQTHSVSCERVSVDSMQLRSGNNTQEILDERSLKSSQDQIRKDNVIDYPMKEPKCPRRIQSAVVPDQVIATYRRLLSEE
jgi:hypothetical protein